MIRAHPDTLAGRALARLDPSWSGGPRPTLVELAMGAHDDPEGGADALARFAADLLTIAGLAARPAGVAGVGEGYLHAARLVEAVADHGGDRQAGAIAVMVEAAALGGAESLACLMGEGYGLDEAVGLVAVLAGRPALAAARARLERDAPELTRAIDAALESDDDGEWPPREDMRRPVLPVQWVGGPRVGAAP